MFYIKKASGKKEPFDITKFKHSLKKAGASEDIIQELAKEIENRGIKTTHDIYAYALSELSKRHPPLAARYNLKQALLQLGPSGFPFEKFIAAIFKEQGFKTETNQIIAGFCVDHEVDVIAHKKEQHYMIESKFHNRPGIKTDVRVTLYVKARFDDIIKKSKQNSNYAITYHSCWVATNTKFTSEAIRYAQCVGIELLGWGYPVKKNIANLVDSLRLHPVTALTSINLKQKRKLIKEGFVLCRDVQQNIQNLQKLGLEQGQIKKVILEAEGVCRLTH